MTLLILPYGRLGNNILQLINCILENIYRYKHDRIDLTLLKKAQPSILKKFPNTFSFDGTEEPILKDTFWIIETKKQHDELVRIIDTYIKPYIDYDLSDTKGIQLEKDLVIHIRSGDIFRKDFPLNRYVQPPLSFYTRIIDETKFEHIYILSESHLLNPVIPALTNKYKHVTFLSNDLDTDFKLMLNCRYFVNSNTTFSIVINLLSNNKQQIFLSHGLTKGYSSCETIHHSNNEYYSQMVSSYEEKIEKLLHC